MKSISKTIESTTYQVWVLGYDENEVITDFETFVNEDKDVERMIKYAKEYVKKKHYKTMAFPNEVKYIEVLVETAVNFEDHTENVETLFSKIVKVK